ncbi:MAG: vWA domain-containing protein [Candidatus Brocadiia bacterium]
MSPEYCVLAEILHDRGLERIWVAGPTIRFGEGGLEPCDMAGSTNGAWLEIRIAGQGATRVLAAENASLDGILLRPGRAIASGSSVTIGNALVTILTESDNPPSGTTICLSPALTVDELSEPMPVRVIEFIGKPGEPPPTPMLSQASPEVLKPIVFFDPVLAREPVAGASAPPVTQPPLAATPAAPAKPGNSLCFAVYDDNPARIVESDSPIVQISRADEATVHLAGSWVGDERVIVSRTADKVSATVLGSGKRITLGGEFVHSRDIKDGEWIVMGSARIRVDFVRRPIEAFLPPKGLTADSLYSALLQSRRSGVGVEEFVTKVFNYSPLLIASLIIHTLVFLTLFLFTVKTNNFEIAVVIESSLDKPVPTQEPVEDDAVITDDSTTVDDTMTLEEMLGEEINMPESSPDGGLGLAGGGNDGGGAPDGSIFTGTMPRPPSRHTSGGPTIAELRKRGLDVVFLFDTTASMDWVLSDVRQSISDIYTITNRLVGNARFGAVAYRDMKPIEEYVTRTQALTTDLGELSFFLSKLEAKGGGDFEEAIQEGMRAVSRLHWRENAFRVVIIFTDAPPHPADVKTCLR